MAKTKTPLLSLGASGTVSDTLTYQKRFRGTIARKKPIPRDPYSLNQAYQRWDYRDYAHLWTLLSNSEKQVYRTKASRYHITGFSQWMRENLKTLPGLMGRWHLDERSGAVAHDSSKQGNNGTIIGASPSAGRIAGGYYFDGLNDMINCGTGVTLTIPYTIELFLYPEQLGVTQTLFNLAPVAQPFLYLNFNNKLLFMTSGNNFLYSAKTFIASDLNKWYHLVVKVLGTTPSTDFHIFINGILDDGVVNDNPEAQTQPTGQFTLGSRTTGANPLKGRLDEAAAHDLSLDDTLILRHSERRYPV